MKTVLVTGASGMIGMDVCYGLLSKGFNVIGTDKQTNEFIGQPNYTFIQSAIHDKGKITSMLESQKVDVLVHLANSCDNDIPTFITDDEMDNSKATDKFIYKAAVGAGVKDILLLSTTMVYASSKSREPIRETFEVKPQSFYGKMKLDSEDALLSAVKKGGTNPVVIRCAPVYKAKFTQNLRDKVYDAKDDTAFVYQGGEYGFSFCCIYNLVEFVNAIVLGPQGHYDGVYNVCDSKPTLAREILEYERAFHRIGPVLQRGTGADAIKTALSANISSSKRAKADYRFLDIGTITNNISYDNTKAKRISTFRWTLANTK
ncbi:MAG: NAD(P)-dependent oxidoreductase [Oscillospiraceae bacterium]